MLKNHSLYFQTRFSRNVVFILLTEISQESETTKTWYYAQSCLGHSVLKIVWNLHPILENLSWDKIWEYLF